MLDFLFDSRTTIWIILALAAVITGVVWKQNRSRGAVIALGTIGALALLYLALGFLITTDEEHIENTLQSMVTKFNENNLDEAFNNFSPQFQYAGLNREDWKQRAKDVKSRYGVSNMRIWDIDVVINENDITQAKVTFKVKVDVNVSNAAPFFRCESVFRKEVDNQWRLTTFQLFWPQKEQPFQIPGVG